MTEMEKLVALLNTYHIPYDILPDCMDGNPQIWYPCRGNETCDVICNKYSYGGTKGYLEIMGLVDEKEVGDTVEGWLTAEEVFGRIHADYYGTV